MRCERSNNIFVPTQQMVSEPKIWNSYNPNKMFVHVILDYNSREVGPIDFSFNFGKVLLVDLID